MRLTKYIYEQEVKRNKAGGIPFYIENGRIQVMLMIPSDPVFGGTSPQIAKGRMDPGDKDTKTAALRELDKELGLKKNNIKNIFLGSINQVLGKDYKLFVYAVEVKDKNKFGKSDSEVKKTIWVDASEAVQTIRKGQILSFQNTVSAIANKYKRLVEEWFLVTGYAGRAIARANETIVWYYMHTPISGGLIWTLPNGATYQGRKKIGNIGFSTADPKATHKKILATFYKKIGFGEYMSGNLRDDVEKILEMNPRGRILDDEIHMYTSEHFADGPIAMKRWRFMEKKAIKAINIYIPEDWKEKLM